METFHHGLTPEEISGLNKELEQHPDLKPKATFVFPLSPERQMAVDYVAADEMPPAAGFLKLLGSTDEVEIKAGLYFLDKTDNLHQTFGALQPLIEKGIFLKRD